jgi:hypothetical protein
MLLLTIIMRKDGIGGACSTHGRDELYVRILVGKPEERNNFGDLHFEGKIILTRILKRNNMYG